GLQLREGVRPLPQYDDRFVAIGRRWGVTPRFFEHQIPRELIYLVPRPFRKDAAELLGESDLISTTCKYLPGGVNGARQFGTSSGDCRPNGNNARTVAAR